MPELTTEGAQAAIIDPIQQLQRSVMACMLFEGNFYERGEFVANRIAKLVKQVPPEAAKNIALKAKEDGLKSAPLFVVAAMATASPEHRRLVQGLVPVVATRPDFAVRTLAYYDQIVGGDPTKVTISNGLKKGLAATLADFDNYQLAKYQNRAQRVPGTDHEVSLKSLTRLVHPKPRDPEAWAQLIAGSLPQPETWEARLSRGEDKKSVFEDLLATSRLGNEAFLKNLRNMGEAKVNPDLIRAYFRKLDLSRIMPFQLITAGRICPEWEPDLEEVLLQVARNYPKLQGKTVLLVDVSGSMNFAVALKSTTLRIDAAAGIAMQFREMCDNLEIYSFSENTVRVAPRRGFALRDAIVTSQPRRKTMLGLSATYLNQLGYDRIVVITDEQADENDVKLPDPVGQHNYIVNVGTEKNGVGYGKWLHIDGFSHSVVQYISSIETNGINITL